MSTLLTCLPPTGDQALSKELEKLTLNHSCIIRMEDGSTMAQDELELTPAGRLTIKPSPDMDFTKKSLKSLANDFCSEGIRDETRYLLYNQWIRSNNQGQNEVAPEDLLSSSSTRAYVYRLKENQKPSRWREFIIRLKDMFSIRRERKEWNLK